MLNNKFLLNLRLFDGAAAAAGATGGEAATGDATATAAPSAAGKGKRANPLAGVQYGVQDAPATETQAQESTQAAAEKPTTTTTSDTLEAKRAEFETLIKGDYKDLFDERMQSIINKRFGETKTLESKLDSMNPILQMLSTKYGVTDGDVEKLSKAIEEDSSYYEQEASERGISVEQLKEFKRLERENAKLREAREEIERRQQADKTYSAWLEQAERMKSVYPNFDLQAEIQNEEFVKLLKSGVDVRAAYQAIHMDEILSGAMQYTAQTVQQQTVNNIKARASRPAENGIASQSGVVVKNDVSKLTAKDRREVAARVARGETIKF